MRLLVISDNHGNEKNLKHVLKNKLYDISIHCGDHEFEDEKIKKMFDYIVPGNNDFYSNMKKELTFEIDGVKILLIHGEYYTSFTQVNTKKILKKYHDVNLVLFGHLHIPIKIEDKGTLFVNPGSIDLPRGRSKKSYAIINIENYNIKNIEHKNI